MAAAQLAAGTSPQPPLADRGAGGGGTPLAPAAVAAYAKRANVSVPVMADLLKKTQDGTLTAPDMMAVMGVPPIYLPEELGGLAGLRQEGVWSGTTAGVNPGGAPGQPDVLVSAGPGMGQVSPGYPFTPVVNSHRASSIFPALVGVGMLWKRANLHRTMTAGAAKGGPANRGGVIAGPAGGGAPPSESAPRIRWADLTSNVEVPPTTNIEFSLPVAAPCSKGYDLQQTYIETFTTVKGGTGKKSDPIAPGSEDVPWDAPKGEASLRALGAYVSGSTVVWFDQPATDETIPMRDGMVSARGVTIVRYTNSFYAVLIDRCTDEIVSEFRWCYIVDLIYIDGKYVSYESDVREGKC